MNRFRIQNGATQQLGEQRQSAFVIVDTETGQIVDTARNEARARLLVIRYNREAAGVLGT